MKAILRIICAAAMAACGAEPVDDVATQFQAELDRVSAEFGFPGATAAYVLMDGTIGTAASGMADVESGLPMTEHSRMLAASIGKSFVSATTIALALEGRLALDAPVSRWLGSHDWFGRLPNHESMTVRHLLTHSAGLPDHVYSEAFAEAFSEARMAPGNPFPPEILVAFILDEPALFAAGQGWAYTDTGYILLGLIMEAATGRSYHEELRARFLIPLGLSNTSPADQRDLRGLAAGYTSPDNPFGLPPKTLDPHGRLQWDPALEWTGGGLVSNSLDLARWGAALFSGQAMRGDYLTELLTAVAVGPESTDVRYGAGVAVYTNGRFAPVYGHGGWIPGYTSSLRHYARYGVTVAFQVNTDIGIIDSEADLLRSIEERLAQVVIAGHTER